jgi:hypothetical protein
VSEPACPVQFYCTGVSNVKDNVAGKLRRYTNTTLHECNVVLVDYVGSVVVPHVLVSAFPVQSFSRFLTGSCDSLPITHHSFTNLDCRLAFQPNELCQLNKLHEGSVRYS